MRSHWFTTACCALCVSAGCLSIEVPEAFLLEEGGSELKLVTADEAKLWVREFDDERQGDLTFWSKALKSDLVDNRGQTLIEERTITDDAGRPGLELLLEVGARGRTYRYLVTMFVFEGLLENTVRVAEYVAPKAVFDNYLEQVRAAVRTLCP